MAMQEGWSNFELRAEISLLRVGRCLLLASTRCERGDRYFVSRPMRWTSSSHQEQSYKMNITHTFNRCTLRFKYSHTLANVSSLMPLLMNTLAYLYFCLPGLLSFNLTWSLYFPCSSSCFLLSFQLNFGRHQSTSIRALRQNTAQPN